MEIHNLMEDEVLRVIDEICDEEERNHIYDYCTSPACRMDAACFVLNRVPQQYVTSSRGLGYLQSEFRENTQLSVDLVTLAHEGLHRVSTNRRSYYDPARREAAAAAAGFRFHFPAIRGRLFDCLTFAPATGVEVWLCRNGAAVSMINARWQNPCALVDSSSGSYLFWPESVPASENEERQVFEFELKTNETDRYQQFHHFFKLEAVASESSDETLRLNRDYQLQDLFLVAR